MIDAQLIHQLQLFIKSFLCGILLHLGRDFFYAIANRKKKTSQILKASFWIFAGIALFLFVETQNNGNIRGYFFLAWLTGWLFYYKMGMEKMRKKSKHRWFIRRWRHGTKEQIHAQQKKPQAGKKEE